MNPSAQAPATANEPQAWQRIVVVLLAVVFFLTPYLISERESEKDPVGAELVGDGLALVTHHEALINVQRNPSLGTLIGTLKTPWWGEITGGQALYRPIPSLLLGLAGAAGGAQYSEAEPGDKTFPYHVIVLALNVLCSLLVLELAWLVFRNAKAALVSGALFATLPIHGEVIYDVAGVAELTATAFSLAAWAAWIRAGDKPFAKPAQLGVALLCLLLATLSKESAFGLPLVFFLFDMRGAKEGGIGAGFRHAFTKIPALVACGVVLAVSLAMRKAVLGQLFPQFIGQHRLDNPLIFEGFMTRAMNALRVLAGGTAAVFGINPLSSNWNFSPDYSANQIQVLGAFSFWNLIGAGAVLLAIVLAVVLYRRCRTRSALVLAFFGATLLTSNLLTPVGTIYADRLMFFPSVAAVMLLAGFLARMNAVGVAIGLVLALGGGYWNWWNGQDHWRNQTDLWGYAAKESAPESAKAHYNNAIDAYKDQVYQLARRDLDKAISIFPLYPQALARLGDLHTLSQEYDLHRSIDLFEAACEVQLGDYDYDYPSETIVSLDSFGPRAMLYRLTRLRVYEEEVYDPHGHLEWLDSLIAKGYDSAYVHHRRGETLRALGELEQAELAFARSLDIEPTKDGIQAYGQLLLDSGRPKDALDRYNSLTQFNSPAEEVAILLDRAEAEFSVGPEAVLATADKLWKMRADLAKSGEYAFSGTEEFRTLYLRAQAKFQMWSPVPTFEQYAELTKILQNALGAIRVRSPETIEASALLQHCLTSQGRYEEARPVLEALLVTREAPSMRFELGKVYYGLGRLQDALDQFTQIDANLVLAAEMFEDEEEFTNILMGTRSLVLQIYSRLDRLDEAFAAIDEWHAAAPGPYDLTALLVQGAWEASRGDLGAAFEVAQALREHFPGNLRSSQLEESLLMLRSLEQRTANSTDPAPYEELAARRRNIGDLEGALEMAERAVALSGGGPAREHARRLSLLAACHEALGDLPAAIDAIQSALELELESEDEKAMNGEIDRLQKRLAG